MTRKFLISRSALTCCVFAITVLALGVSCSSSSGEEFGETTAIQIRATSVLSTAEKVPTSTDTPSALPTAARTVRPTSTIRPVSTVGTPVSKSSLIDPVLAWVPVSPIDPASVVLAGCRLPRSLRTVTTIGTAPGPTPTPMPDVSHREDAVIRAEIAQMLPELAELSEIASHWSAELLRIWNAQLVENERASIINYVANRLSTLCAALGSIDVVPEAVDVIFGLADALKSRAQWLSIAYQALVESGTGVTADLANGNTETHGYISDAQAGIRSLADQYGTILTKRPKIMRSEVIGVVFSVPPGMIPVRSGLDMVAISPDLTDSLGTELLGPGDWKLGEGLRIRRIRKIGDPSPQEAFESFRDLLIYAGTEYDVIVGDRYGYDAATIVWRKEGSTWHGETTLLLRDSFVYFVEWVCNGLPDSSCNAITDVSESVEFVD